MSISGIGSYNGYFPSASLGGATGTSGTGASGTAAAAATDASSATSPTAAGSDGNSAFQFLTNYLKESPAKRMEDAWLAQHHLTEQALNAMPPQQQAAIRKQMAEDIKKKMQEQSGTSGTGAVLNIQT